jgi:hypothetical protein
MMMIVRNGAVQGSLLSLGCGSSNSTAPSSPTPTIAPPSFTESFNGALAIGASKFFSFTVGANGAVNIPLTALIQDGGDSVSLVALALATPGGTGCRANTTVTTAASSTPQLTGTYPSGVYCAMISDVGNPSTPSTFMIAIAHP